jgi:hypothetical protein
MLAHALAVASALLCTASGPVKVALMPLPAGEGVSDKAAVAITEAITAEVRRVPGVQLITQQEISSMLSLEKQKGLLGCADETCLAELGGALGVDRLVTGNINKLGETWMFNLKLADVKKAKVVAQSDRRLRKAAIDDLLEQIPAMVGELFGAAPTQGPVRTVEPPKADPKPEPAVVAPAPNAPPVKFGPNGVDEPVDKATKLDDLKVLSDGKGHYVALPPKWEGAGVRCFYGDAKAFWAVRTTGGGANGSQGTFDHSLWDPRFRDSYGSDASLGRSPEGKYLLTCGTKKKVEVELKELPAADAKKIVKGAKFFQSRWRRQAYALARDDEGHFFYVDEAREKKEGERDFHFYMGTKGKMQGYETTDYVYDSAAEIFVTPAGRLKRKLDAGEGKLGEWIVGQQKTPLSWLALDNQTQFAYTALGVYAGERLGQPCDALVK